MASRDALQRRKGGGRGGWASPAVLMHAVERLRAGVALRRDDPIPGFFCSSSFRAEAQNRSARGEARFGEPHPLHGGTRLKLIGRLDDLHGHDSLMAVGSRIRSIALGRLTWTKE